MRRGIEQVIAPQALIILSVAAAIYSPIWYLIVIAFTLTLAIYIWRGYDPRFLIGVAIFLFITCAIILALGWVGWADWANQIAMCAYYFIAIGVIAQLIKFLRERRHLPEK